MSDHILVSTDGAVQIIRFNRPDKKNAITRDMYSAMSEVLIAGEADDAIRCHVILGTPGAFSSGNDVQDFMAFAASGDLGTEVLGFLTAMADLKKPFISGVDGLAIGIGTTIHMHCDLTFATPQSVFKTPFVDLGLVPEAASSLLGPQIMGHQRSYALLAMGEAFSAEQAKDAGLIYEIVESDKLEAKVMEVAKTLAARAPTAMGYAKRLMKADPDVIKARMEQEAKLFGEQLVSDEARQAFMAFMTRKK